MVSRVRPAARADRTAGLPDRLRRPADLAGSRRCARDPDRSRARAPFHRGAGAPHRRPDRVGSSAPDDRAGHRSGGVGIRVRGALLRPRRDARADELDQLGVRGRARVHGLPCRFELCRTDPVLSKLMTRPLNVTMLGAGPGAELVAFGAAAAAEASDGVGPEGAAAEESCRKKPMNLGVVDIGSFTSVTRRLAANVNKLSPSVEPGPPEAAPAETAAEAAPAEAAPAEAAPAPQLLKAKYLQVDMLTTPVPTALAKMYSGSHLVTAMFVVNELFQQDKGRALEFLDQTIGEVFM